MTEPTVVVAGHICLDVIPDFSRNAKRLDQIFVPGMLVEIGPASVTTGGAVSNTGLALHKLGVPVKLMGKVGNDPFGEAITEIISSYDQELIKGLCNAVDEKTSYSIILSLPGIDRMFLHYPGANDTFVADDIDYDTVARARIFHFGYPPAMKRMCEGEGRELVQIFRRVKTSGVITSLDMVMPDPATRAVQCDWHGILKNVLPFVDLFVPSMEEMVLMLDSELFNELSKEAGAVGVSSRLSVNHFARMANRLLDLGASVVGLKAGSKGLYLRTGVVRNSSPLIDARFWSHRELWAPCFRANVVDTTGAGDATVAGFLAGMLRGLGPEQTLIGAVATGACSVEAVGAVAGVVPWPEMHDRIADGWDNLPLNFDSSDWRFDEVMKIWKGPNDRSDAFS